MFERLLAQNVKLLTINSSKIIVRVAKGEYTAGRCDKVAENTSIKHDGVVLLPRGFDLWHRVVCCGAHLRC